MDVVQRPSVQTFHRAVAHTVNIGGFANCKAANLKKIHPDLTVNIAVLWRRAQGERTNLSPFPAQLKFIRKYLPFDYLFHRFGDVIYGLPGIPVFITDKEAQEISMYLLVLPAFVRKTIKRIYCQYFKATDFDRSLLKIMKRRKMGTVARITKDVRTIYNTLVKQKRIPGKRSKTSFEPIYTCAIRLASLLIRGTISLSEIVSAHKTLLYAETNNIDTVVAKLSRLKEFLSDVAIGFKLDTLSDFIECGRYEFDSKCSNHQSDPIPPEIVGYEVRTFLENTSDPHKQIRAACTALMAGIGTRIGCILNHKRARWEPRFGHAVSQFLDNKTKKAGGRCQQVAIPFYEHRMCPSRALKILDELVGSDRIFLVGYVPRGKRVCQQNFQPHTRGSMKHLISAIFADVPTELRGTANRKKITPNTWRFTAEAIRTRANVPDRCRIHAKQHLPDNQTEHYALNREEIFAWGEKLRLFWENIERKLSHQKALRLSARRRPSITYGGLKKRRKSRSGLNPAL